MGKCTLIARFMGPIRTGPRWDPCLPDRTQVGPMLAPWTLLSGYLTTLQWRHNESDGVSIHQPHDCLLNCLFKHSSKKTSKHRVTGLFDENSLMPGEFPAQRASNTKKVSIWWRHHEKFWDVACYPYPSLKCMDWNGELFMCSRGCYIGVISRVAK